MALAGREWSKRLGGFARERILAPVAHMLERAVAHTRKMDIEPFGAKEARVRR